MHAESRAPREDEPIKGFLLRLHLDPTCLCRLSPEHLLIAKRFEEAKADSLCPECAGSAVAAAHSSVVRRLKEAERTLRALHDRANDGPMPREVVHCLALRHEAETAQSVHPEATELAARVTSLATEVADRLKDAMRRYDHAR